jgi:hypothetical protein
VRKLSERQFRDREDVEAGVVIVLLLFYCRNEGSSRSEIVTGTVISPEAIKKFNSV